LAIGSEPVQKGATEVQVQDELSILQIITFNASAHAGIEHSIEDLQAIRGVLHIHESGHCSSLVARADELASRVAHEIAIADGIVFHALRVGILTKGKTGCAKEYGGEKSASQWGRTWWHRSARYPAAPTRGKPGAPAFHDHRFMNIPSPQPVGWWIDTDLGPGIPSTMSGTFTKG
jgi:hypothetical protein